jgi:hypothetical protein
VGQRLDRPGIERSRVEMDTWIGHKTTMIRKKLWGSLDGSEQVSRNTLRYPTASGSPRQ